MKITQRQAEDVTILDISGKITLGGGGSAALRNEVRTILKDGHKKILANLGEVSYVDNSGIGELVSAYTTTSNQGGSFKLLSPSKKLLELLGITKLLTVFEVHDDEQCALASFK